MRDCSRDVLTEAVRPERVRARPAAAGAGGGERDGAAPAAPASSSLDMISTGPSSPRGSALGELGLWRFGARFWPRPRNVGALAGADWRLGAAEVGCNSS